MDSVIEEMLILWCVWWYTPLKWRVPIRMIGIISSWVTHSLLVTLNTAVQRYRSFTPFTDHRCTRTRILSPLVVSQQQISVLLNHTLKMLLHYSTNKVFTSHFKSSQDDCSQLANHELPTAVSHRELLIIPASVSPINPWSDMQENASIVASLLTRSRDSSPLLRHPSVYSCCLAKNEARRCDAMRDSARHGENTASSTVA
jgi:hypothetical protein